MPASPALFGLSGFAFPIVDGSSPMSFGATDAVHYRCLLAIQEVLRSLLLDGVNLANIQVRWLPKFREQVDGTAVDQTPLIIVSPSGTEAMMGGLNNTDDIGFPCTVVMFDKDPDLTNNLSRNLKWREQAIRALDQQRLAGVTEIEKVNVIPDPVLDLEAWRQRYWVSAFVAQCVGRLALS